MKIALCQMNIAFEKKETNLKKALEFIKSAAAMGADLILFPEMSFTGFSMNVALTGESDDYSINTIKKAALTHNIAVSFGYVYLNGSKGENRYVLISADGEILSDYNKIHSFAIGGEREDFISGNTLPSPVSIASQKISTFICYDLRFPEIFRAVADNSTLITVAANWPKARREHWMALLKARAIENQVYIAGINCTGNQDGIEYCGDSMVINPWGKIIASAKSADEELIICEIADDTEKIRETFPVGVSRKFELYKEILNHKRS